MFNIRTFEEHTKRNSIAKHEFIEWKAVIYKMMICSSYDELLNLNKELSYRRHGLWMLYMGLGDYEAVDYCVKMTRLSGQIWERTFEAITSAQDARLKELLETNV